MNQQQQQQSAHPYGGAQSMAQAALSGTAQQIPPATNLRKRRASGTPSSRGVANLTPEQLAKKRANDREAQRAIRERTRNQIEGLERRIRELESQQPFQELQNAIRARDATAAENEDLKRRLQSVMAIVQPAMPQAALNELAALTAQQSPLPLQQHTAPSYPSQTAQVNSNAFPAQEHIHPDLRSPHTASSSPQIPQYPAQPGQNQETSLKSWSPSMDQLRSGDYHQQQQQQNSASQAQMEPQQANGQQGGRRFGLGFLLDGNQRIMNLNASSHPPQDTSRNQALSPTTQDQSQQPIYARLPRTTPATCPLDSILLDFLAQRRTLASAGTPTTQLLGPNYPSINSLLNPNQNHAAHPLSQVFTDILSKFPHLSGLPEQVAVLYIMFLVMRWHVAPTSENYERLPEWMRPVQAQLEKAHGAWVDHLPWPHMRAALVNAPTPTTFLFDNFFIPFTTTLSLNWPYDPMKCLQPATRQNTYDMDAAGCEEGEEWSITPIFEEHLRKLENWSLGRPFEKAFPELVDASVRIHDQ